MTALQEMLIEALTGTGLRASPGELAGWARRIAALPYSTLENLYVALAAAKAHHAR